MFFVCCFRITAIVRTRDIEAGIILKITIQVKSFEEMNSTDVTIAYILGGEKVKSVYNFKLLNFQALP